MSILVNKHTKVICQGFTGKQGTFHSEQAIAYGTRLVGGVTPGRGGQKHLNLPVFDTVRDAVKETGATASMIYVPAAGAADSILEAADAGIELVVCITEGVPVNDMVRVKAVLAGSGTRLVGPNCPGVITPGRMQDRHHARLHSQEGRGRHRVALRHADIRSGLPDDQHRPRPEHLCRHRRRSGPRLNFIDVLELFERDPRTEGIILVGEIGGSDEEAAAHFIHRFVSKPVVAYIAGVTAPPGKRMGHAGAIVAGGKGTAADKYAAFEAAGVRTVKSPAELGTAMNELLRRRRASAKAKAVRPAPAPQLVARPAAKATRKPPQKPAAKPVKRAAKPAPAPASLRSRRSADGESRRRQDRNRPPLERADAAKGRMSESLRIALAQLDLLVGDVQGNAARVIESARAARPRPRRRPGRYSPSSLCPAIRRRTCCSTAASAARSSPAWRKSAAR